MDFDFSSISDGSDLSAIRDPAALFDALPSKHAGLGYLRQVQATVLSKWSPRRAERDLVIKMNTGTGKTIVGLLILQTSLHDETGPAAYLAPTPQLATRAALEAQRLGLATVTEHTDGRFQRGEAIWITTLQRFFNGRSRFGPRGEDVPRLGSVVIDDAHSALGKLEEYSRFLVPRDTASYEQLMNIFRDSLKEQNAAVLMDIDDGDRRAVMRIPFWTWQAQSEAVLAILHPLRESEMLRWAWPLLGDHLPVCAATLTSEGIEVAPPLPPVQKFQRFIEAPRRVYMTATLANDSALVTHFAADPSAVSEPIAPESAADLGDRLVLAPQELLPDLTDADLRAALAAIAVTDNVVVLAPSWSRAREWGEYANETVSTSEQIDDVVARLQRETVGVVVIVNQYDGIDLPDDACRVLVIDGLPQAAAGSDRREAAALRDSNALITRQIQRVEQGMGRGVRSREDRCAVLVMDRRLVELISRPDVPEQLSPGTRAQLQLSRKVARMVRGTGGVTIDGLIDLVRKVTDGAEDFKTEARKALLGVTYETVPLHPTAVPQRAAYDDAARGVYQGAADRADEAVNAARQEMKDERLADWLTEQAAAYRNMIDTARAQTQLAAAAARNGTILRPLAGLSFKARRPTRMQAEAAASYLATRYTTGAQLRIGVEALVDALGWDSERTDEAEQAWADLGKHLGFEAQRPEQQLAEGPDVLWSDSEGNHYVIEAKTGATASLIAKRYVDQLGGSVRWAEQKLSGANRIIPMLVHPSPTVEHSGTPVAGAVVVDTDRSAALRAAVRDYATALAADDKFGDTNTVQAQLIQLGLNGLALASRYGSPVRTERH